MKYIGWIIATIIIIIFLVSVTYDPQKVSNDLFQQVADDAITQYDIAKRHGSQIDICLRAQLVAESFLQGNNEIEYANWRGIQKTECGKAGLDF
jgi:hypothetical protein